jgi:DNA-binding MarR family transcriptional regulator
MDMVHTMNGQDAFGPSSPAAPAPELTPEQRARFSRMLDRLYQCCSDRHAALAASFAIPQAEMRALMLFGQERYLTAKGIAAGLAIAKSRVTRLVEGLAAKGLVSRVSDPADSRVTLLSLTPKGRETRRAVQSRMDSLRDEVLGRIDPAGRDMVLRSLETLKAAMERTAEATRAGGGVLNGGAPGSGLGCESGAGSRDDGAAEGEEDPVARPEKGGGR